MNDSKADRSEAIVSDILAERGPYDVYRKSRSIPFSRTNTYIGLGVGIIVFLLAIKAKTTGSIVDAIASFANVAFGTSISLLGFLIAGFAFFATVADKKLFCRMAEHQHEESKMSYLKYNLLIFMRVFYEYMVFSFVLLILLIITPQGSTIRTNLRTWVGEWKWPEYWNIPVSLEILLAGATFGILVGSFAYLLMQLKSFVFNIYHVVMTSVAWEYEREAYPDQDNAAKSARELRPEK